MPALRITSSDAGIEYPSFARCCNEVLHEYNVTDNDPKIMMSRSDEFWKFNYHDFPKMAEIRMDQHKLLR